MSRPIRTKISEANLTLMGVPKRFHHIGLMDFKTDGDEDLEKVKSFFLDYLTNIGSVFQDNKGVLLYGSNGVGKTMLSCMIVTQAYKHRYTARRVTFVDYINAYAKMWGARTPDEKEYLEQEFYNNYKSVEFLILEEIGKEIDSKVATPILEDCLRYREDKGLVTVICTNLKPSIIKEKYGVSCYSLMTGNMTPVCISSKDQRPEVFNKEDN